MYIIKHICWSIFLYFLLVILFRNITCSVLRFLYGIYYKLGIKQPTSSYQPIWQQLFFPISQIVSLIYKNFLNAHVKASHL